ncbi:hypothetical protein B0H16DRAFT_1662312 [Mycena metata]|uniref:DNA 3'-5' helicase n=1 Tax=Mycena metata TaxID=1033252 RepID=A0AAD7JB72_9AGAR|nr:hypothetical protein B0H16DRAFT_1662312 [Mycena metata]
MVHPDSIPTVNWPPPRIHTVTPVQTPLRRNIHRREPSDTFESPSNPLAPTKHKKQHRNGYEQSPQTPSFLPFSLNNPGAPRQRAFDLSKQTRLEPEWNSLAQKSHAIPAGGTLHSYQVQIANLVLRCQNDAIVIAATGSGKSLSWTLPLLARKEGISLVVTPYTSLGLDAEESNSCDGITSIFIYSEQNTMEDFEKVATVEMLVVYVCPEMLESPSFARLLHSKSWQGRLSGIYIDEAHLVHQTHVWRPSYSRIYQLRNIVGHNIPLMSFRHMP